MEITSYQRNRKHFNYISVRSSMGVYTYSGTCDYTESKYSNKLPNGAIHGCELAVYYFNHGPNIYVGCCYI